MSAFFREHLDRIAAGPWTPEVVNAVDLSKPGRHLPLVLDDGGRIQSHSYAHPRRRGNEA